MQKGRCFRGLSVFLFVFAWASQFAQTGPAGVGTSTSNKLWLKADANVYNDAGTTLASNNDLVQQWNDKSGNSNNASQATSGNRPRYVTNVINGKPALRFTGDTYIDAGALGIVGTGGFTFLFVFKDTSYVAGAISDGAGDYILDRTPANNELTGLKISSTDKYCFQKRDNSGGGIGGPVSTTAVNTSSFHIIDYMRERGTAYRLFLDGTLETSIADGDGDLTPPNPRIGRHATTASNGIKGYIAEMLVYDYRVNNAQVNILNSYLAAKYGLTISNDKYSYDATHSVDVAGIGRVDASNTHTDAQSAAILEVNTPGSLGDGDYLLFGHDNASIASWTTTEAPNSGTDVKRLTREWRLDETDGGGGDGVGTMKFIIDTTLLPARTSTYTKYVLMVDADGDFSSGASVYEMSSPGANNYFETASTIDINDGDYVTIGEVRPTIGFSASISSGFEPANANLAVTLNYIAKTAVSVTYNTANGTAVAPGDYTAVAGGTLTVPVGSSSANITITVINDVVVEGDETFTVTISGPPAGINLGTITTHTFTIHDDDNLRKIYFTAASSSGTEATTPAVLTVSIDVAQIDPTNPTTVDYSVTGGTATGGGTDYTLASGTATIAINAQTTTISITINDDAIYEASETIIVSLTNPTNGNLSSTNPIDYTYTITDNDPPPVIQFSSTSSSGAESVASVNFPVTLSFASSFTTTVAYTITGTATGAGTDYTLASGTLTIAAGVTSANITATIVDDAIVEFPETIIATLSAPTNSTLGANTVYTYTITDNDVFGYTGPGGVGDLNTNKLWLKADANAYSDAGTTSAVDAATVQQWNDQSGNSNNVSQGTAGNRPIYKTNIVNSQPALNFTGSTYVSSGALGIAATGGFTYFLIVEATSYSAGATNDGSGDYILDRTTGTNELASLKVASTSKFGFQKRDNSGGGLGGPVTTTSITTGAFQLIDYMRVRGSAFQLYLNGTMENSVADGQGDLTPPAMRIGTHQSGSNGLRGYISELVVYNQNLNSAQRIIVENYLAAKYGLSILAASDHFAYDATYGNDVAGIGREDATNYHTDARGSGIVRINNASSMDIADYFLWGYNNISFETRDSIDVPTAQGVPMRMGRVWRASEAGELGTMDISFDLTGLGSVTTGDLRLLIDKTNNGFADETVAAGTIISGATNMGSNVYKFSGININDSWRFTLGTVNSVATPLPIKLIYFAAVKDANHVNVKWTTATELNNDYFTIEKSKDGSTFEFAAKLKGAGNSYSILNYSTIDDNPYKGVSYYRLKQTDYDGKFSYSNIIAVEFNPDNTSIFAVYPNPINTGKTLNLSIIGKIGEEVVVIVHDVIGKENYSKVVVLQTEGDNVYVIDESNRLAAGVYFITATSNQTIYSKRLIVK